MTSPPGRHTQVPCANYEMSRTWVEHIERQRRRGEPRAWSEPTSGTIPCQHCGWSGYLHEIAAEVTRRAVEKARAEAKKAKGKEG